jgi:hypothetical protein
LPFDSFKENEVGIHISKIIINAKEPNTPNAVMYKFANGSHKPEFYSHTTKALPLPRRGVGVR